MPAPIVPISGYTMVLKAAGSVAVAAQEDVTLNVEQDLPEIYSTASARWASFLYGLTGFSIDFSNLYYESAPAHGCGASLSIGGTDVKGITSFTINCSMDMLESSNQTTACVRAYVAGKRTVTVDFEGVYYDPAGTGNTAFLALVDEIEGATTAGLANTTLAFGTSTLTGTTRPSSIAYSFSAEDVAKYSGSLSFVGAPTLTSASLDAGQDHVFDSLFSETNTVTVQVITTSATTSQTRWSAQAHTEALTISVPHDDAIRVSGTMRITGALTRLST